jgi:hypothetical protein
MSRSTARTSGSEPAGDGPSTGAKEASARKTATKRTAAKAPTKKSPPKKPAAKRTDAPSDSRRAKPRASEVAVQATSQLLDLTGKEVEGVVALDRSDAGWTVRIEVLELRRIPSTTDVLATYEVAVDEDGDLVGYRRLSRYVRGAPGED